MPRRSPFYMMAIAIRLFGAADGSFALRRFMVAGLRPMGGVKG